MCNRLGRRRMVGVRCVPGPDWPRSPIPSPASRWRDPPWTLPALMPSRVPLPLPRAARWPLAGAHPPPTAASVVPASMVNAPRPDPATVSECAARLSGLLASIPLWSRRSSHGH
jgi:hypothetical protein